MGFFEVAKSNILYICVIIGILYVVGFSVVFGIKSYRRALEIGITKKKMMNVIKSSAIFTIVPSLAIVIGFFSLTTMLGIPWPWFRLSVIGSVTYELMAVDSVFKTIGLATGAGASGEIFGIVMFVMTICILGGITMSIFTSKRIQQGTLNLKAKDQRWGTLAMSTFMTSIVVVFLVPIVLKGGVYLLTLLSSAVIAAILSMISKKLNVKWLEGFILSFSLLGAMALSVLWTNILG